MNNEILKIATKAGLQDQKDLSFEHFIEKAKKLLDEADLAYYDPVLENEMKDNVVTCSLKLIEAEVVIKAAWEFNEVIGF